MPRTRPVVRCAFCHHRVAIGPKATLLPDPVRLAAAALGDRGIVGAVPDRVPLPLRRLGLCLLHVWLVFHLAAIVIAPATIEPSSQLQRNGFLVVGPYLEAVSLNHGYHYFAPDPGESRLVEATWTGAGGQKQTRRLPDREIVPRLLYHRYFMITESQPQASDDPDRARQHYAAIENGFRRRYGWTGGHVELTRIRHRLARPQLIRAGFGLDDPEQYIAEPVRPTTVPTTPSEPIRGDAAALPPPEPLP